MGRSLHLGAEVNDTVWRRGEAVSFGLPRLRIATARVAMANRIAEARYAKLLPGRHRPERVQARRLALARELSAMEAKRIAEEAQK